MRWKGGERNSKEVRDIERYMEMRKGKLSGDGKRERYIEMTKMKNRSQANGDNYKDEKKK